MPRKKYPLLPDRLDYYPAAVEVMKSKGGSVTIEEMEEGVSKLLGLSDEARSVLHGEGPRTQFQYDLAWVRTFLKWDGAVENSERGVWHLTPRGSEMTREELRSLWGRIVAKQRAARREREQLEETTDAQDLPDDEAPEVSWKERLLDVLLTLEPAAFERLCQRLLRESGFTKVEITGRSGDGGIDGVGVLRMNLLSFHVLFQCKRWKTSVGAPVIRDFRGAMVGRADKGLILSTSSFTPDAKREATRDGAPAIDLVDGDTLCDLLKTARLGVSVTMVEEVAVDEVLLRSV